MTEDHCRLTDGSDGADGCITCGDTAVALTVVDVIDSAGSDARCRDDAGRTELIATELVGPVRPGDRLLAHAGVAIGRLDEEGGDAVRR
jgi:hydrogenase maturation factor